MYNKILCLNFNRKDLHETDWRKIHQLSQKVILINKDNPSLTPQIQDTDCLLVKLGEEVGSDIINKAPNLKYIGMLGTGYGRIDTKLASKRGISVCNIPGYSTEAVSELLFGLLIKELRGEYKDGFLGAEIKNKNFGIIGLGKIGSRIGEIALGFQAQVSYNSQHRKKEYENRGLKYKNIDKILEESDFISINLALNPKTRLFLNKDRIKMIKSEAIVINLAPTELIDIKALSERLKKDDLTFILDHSDELSKEDLKLLSQYKNCIIYPPIGYLTKEATEAKMSIFIQNLQNFLKEKPTNRVN